MDALWSIPGNFFDKEGNQILNKETKKTIGVKIDSFKNSTTVLIAGGKNKISQIQSALKSGLFSGLITDEDTSKKI